MLKDLLDAFVRVRLVRAEKLDLSVFQFSPDLTFAVFFLNADKTIYGRYGSRTDLSDAERDISLAGLRKAMERVLDLHRKHAKVKESLKAKTGPKPKYQTPSEYPWVKSRRLGQKHCMHCHHIGNAEHMIFRAAKKPIPDDALFTWPMPNVVGLKMDPKEVATILEITPKSPAALAGFQAKDEIVKLAGQPIISTADIQWVLNHAGESATLKAEVQRNGSPQTLVLDLPKGWRDNMDIAWRITSFWLRRVGLGGMRLDPVSEADRTRLGVGKTELALRVRTVWRNAQAIRAGVRQGDILVAFAGQKNRLTENDLVIYGARHTKAGDRVPVTVLRKGKRINLTIQLTE